MKSTALIHGPTPNSMKHGCQPAASHQHETLAIAEVLARLEPPHVAASSVPATAAILATNLVASVKP